MSTGNLDLDAAFGDEPEARTEIVRIVDNIAPLLDALRMHLADFERWLVPLDDATPQEREAIGLLRAQLVALAQPIEARIKAIDARALVAFAKTGADQLPMSEGRYLTVRRPTAGYDIDANALRRDLLGIVEAGGSLTIEEVEDAVRAEVHYVPNNTRLNYLSRHRGDAVQKVIDTHRRVVTADPAKGKVLWPKPKED